MVPPLRPMETGKQVSKFGTCCVNKVQFVSEETTTNKKSSEHLFPSQNYMFQGYDKFVQLCGSNKEVLTVFKSSDFSVC